MIGVFKNLVISLRPKQWAKNSFVVLPYVFSQKMSDVSVAPRALAAFALFCLFSSIVYLINDVFDLENDKSHSKKSKRPLANGLLSVKMLMICSLVLLSIAVVGSYLLDKKFLLIGLVYLFIGNFYTIFLKRIAIIDVFCIAAGFILRVVAGCVAVGVPPSYWILVTTLFLSLFLGFAKRRGEIALSVGSPEQLSRLVLRQYSVQLLDQFLVICATASIMSYALFTLSDYTLARFGTNNLFFTIPFVVFGVFRYFYLIHFSDYYENPTEVLFTDKALIVDIFLWIACVIFIVYV